MPSPIAHHCPICNAKTVPQAFSGGREWFCETCEAEGLYADVRIDAPSSTPVLLVPSGFLLDIDGGSAWQITLACKRPGCTWGYPMGSTDAWLTELATLAVEHVQDAHR